MNTLGIESALHKHPEPFYLLQFQHCMNISSSDIYAITVNQPSLKRFHEKMDRFLHESIPYPSIAVCLLLPFALFLPFSDASSQLQAGLPSAELNGIGTVPKHSGKTLICIMQTNQTIQYMCMLQHEFILPIWEVHSRVW